MKMRRLMIGLVLMGHALVMNSNAQGEDAYPRWLAIGDSITQHGPKADLGWEGETRGMAASALETDYVHLLEAKLKEKNAANAAEVKIVGRLGKLSAGTITDMGTVVEELRSWDADLVTIQLGENDHLNEIGAEGFEKLYAGLVDGLLSGSKKPVVLCTGVWAAGEPADPSNPEKYKEGTEPYIKEEIIKKICEKRGLKFVPLARLATDRANYGTGASAGVQWHPNDSGMKGYADSIYAALYPDGAAR